MGRSSGNNGAGRTASASGGHKGATRKMVTVHGSELPLALSREDAWKALESAGIKVWRKEGDDGKTRIRAYDPSASKKGYEAYVRLELGQAGSVFKLGADGIERADDSAAYARPVVKTYGSVSGAFAANVRQIVDRTVEKAL